MSVSNHYYVSEGQSASWYNHSTVAVLLYDSATTTLRHLYIPLQQRGQVLT